MMKNKLLIKIIVSLLLAVALAVPGGGLAAADSQNSARVILVHGEINSALVSYMDREITAAEQSGADVIIFDIDTWGGFIMSAEKINEIITATETPTIAYISKKAVSAGVMVAISCDNIVMTEGSHSGAAETIPNDEKTLSAWVGMLTAAAEQSGRPMDVVKAMADKREVIEGLTQEGELLDITANKAVEYGYADIIANTYEQALTSLGYEGYDISTAEVTMADKAARALTGEAVLTILFSAGIFFMIMELFTAGFGIFGVLAIICFGLYFFGGVIAGYTQWWSVALFALGTVALVIEIFIPGFGVFGAVGIVLILLGLLFSAKSLNDMIIRMGIAVLICAVSIPILFKIFGRLKLFDRIVHKQGETTEQGYTAPSLQNISVNGMTGIAATDLRPSGVAEIDGRRYDVLSHQGFIKKGTTLIVTETSGNRIIVKSDDAE